MFSFCVLCLHGGASAGFSLSLKCERRQSMALPRTHSRTHSKQKRTGKTGCFFKSYLFFLTRYGRFRLRFFLFVRVCAAEPRPDFRCRSNANDGKARLCRVLPRGLAPKRKQQVSDLLYFQIIFVFLRDTAVSAFDSFYLSVYARRSLGRIFATAQMRTTAKHGFAAYSLEDSLQKENSRSLTCCFLFGAGNEIRTRDICLGKATLYH